MTPTTLTQINDLEEDVFVAAFGDVAERSAWVARDAARRRPFGSRETLAEAFRQAVFDAPAERQLALFRAHPDLAGRAAVAGDIADASAAEQAGAGLDKLSEAEFVRFCDLNDAYRRRFGFPFILAVRGAGKAEILAAFEARLANTREAEFAEALQQVCRIVAFRLEDRVIGE